MYAHYAYSTHEVITMPRLNISISDELHTALEPWRDRLNISQICAEALTREVAKLNDLPRQAVELTELVERLQREKAHAQKYAYGQGVTDGIAWARGAAYSELHRWGEGTLSSQAGDGALCDALERHRNDPEFDEQAYREGWKMGIEEVWQRVQDKV